MGGPGRRLRFLDIPRVCRSRPQPPYFSAAPNAGRIRVRRTARCETRYLWTKHDTSEDDEDKDGAKHHRRLAGAYGFSLIVDCRGRGIHIIRLDPSTVALWQRDWVWSFLSTTRPFRSPLSGATFTLRRFPWLRTTAADAAFERRDGLPDWAVRPSAACQDGWRRQ